MNLATIERPPVINPVPATTPPKVISGQLWKKPSSEPSKQRSPDTPVAGQLPFADSDSPTDGKHADLANPKVNLSHQIKKQKPVTSTVSPPIPFYERLAKELLSSNSNSSKSSKSSTLPTKSHHLAPKATLDELFEDEIRDLESSLTECTSRTGSSNNGDRLQIIESKVKKDKTIQDEQLLRSWFKIKNSEH
jgi:hypothetical protein